jgi:hypothetical protein
MKYILITILLLTFSLQTNAETCDSLTYLHNFYTQQAKKELLSSGFGIILTAGALIAMFNFYRPSPNSHHSDQYPKEVVAVYAVSLTIPTVFLGTSIYTFFRAMSINNQIRKSCSEKSNQ